MKILVMTKNKQFKQAILDQLTAEQFVFTTIPTQLMMGYSDCSAILWDLDTIDVDTSLATMELIKMASPIPIIVACRKGKDYPFQKLFDLDVDYIVEQDFLTFLSPLLRHLTQIKKKKEPAQAERKPNRFRAGDLLIDFEQFEVRKADHLIHLTPKEFQLLRFFAENHDQVLSRSRLLTGIWQFGFLKDSRMIDMQVKNLRAKIEDNPHTPKYIDTIRGFGYRFNSQV